MNSHSDFMLAVRGYSAWRVATALGALTSGVDWRKCSKHYMAEKWSLAVRHGSGMYPRLKDVTLDALKAKLADLYPPPSVTLTLSRDEADTLRTQLRYESKHGDAFTSMIVYRLEKALGLVSCDVAQDRRRPNGFIEEMRDE